MVTCERSDAWLRFGGYDSAVTIVMNYSTFIRKICRVHALACGTAELECMDLAQPCLYGIGSITTRTGPDSIVGDSSSGQYAVSNYAAVCTTTRVQRHVYNGADGERGGTLASFRTTRVNSFRLTPPLLVWPYCIGRRGGRGSGQTV